MASNSEKKNKRTSVNRRFNRVLLLMYVLSIAISVPTIYWYTERQVNQQAERELKILVDMVQSIQGYIAGSMRPFLMENNLFHSPGFSGIVATSLIAEKFKQFQPDYYIKNVSDNPLNPENFPKPFEKEVLEAFRADQQLKDLTKVGFIDDQRMLVAAAPKMAKKGCMKCHGDPDEVPEQITSEFGTTYGYYYKLGDVVGASVVGVPIDDVRKVALERSLVASALLGIIFALVLLTVKFLVKRLLLAPIMEIAQVAHDVSKGDLEQKFETDRNDEIGDLVHSMELLRRSFVHAFKRLSK